MKGKIIIISVIILAVLVFSTVLIFIFHINGSNKPAGEASQNNQTNNGTANMPENNNPPSNPEEEGVVVKNMSHIIVLKTSMGEIRVATYDADAPKTVENFITLANKGFYDNLIFHRVIDKFMIQGGDPTGTGRGGPGYSFGDELYSETESYKIGYVKGTVAMANAGPNTNGSQFFIMVADQPLPHNYTIFGKVISGQDVADAIARVKTDANNKPLLPVIMQKVTVLNVPESQ